MKPLTRADLNPDPIAQFQIWYFKAQEFEEIAYANAFCLSTLTPEGYPDGRVVLLKSFDEKGFVFYTNIESNKGLALKKLPRACATFYWDPLGQQIRIRGEVSLVREKEADQYFSSRDRQSQIGAWASAQSKPLASREELEKKVREYTEKFAGVAIPRPPHWSGYRIAPIEVEFWKFGKSRLHDRFLYKRTDSAWEIIRRNP